MDKKQQFDKITDILKKLRWNDYRDRINNSDNNPKINFETFYTLMILYEVRGYVFSWFVSENNADPIMQLLLNLHLITVEHNRIDHDVPYPEEHSLCRLTEFGRSYIHFADLDKQFDKIIAPDSLKSVGDEAQKTSFPSKIIPVAFSSILICVVSIFLGIIMHIPILEIVLVTIISSFIGGCIPIVEGDPDYTDSDLDPLDSDLNPLSHAESIDNKQMNLMADDLVSGSALTAFDTDHSSLIHRNAFVDFISRNPKMTKWIESDSYNQLINSINNGGFGKDPDYPFDLP